MKELLKSLIGKEIQVWPTDTLSKYGVLVDANDQGILVKVDGKRSQDGHWSEDGVLFFISFSANLIFKEVVD